MPFTPCVCHISHVLKFSEALVYSGAFVFYKKKIEKTCSYKNNVYLYNIIQNKRYDKHN